MVGAESYRRESLARGEETGHLLDTMVAGHERLARLLETLPDADWARQGRVGEHAEEHAAQITEAARTA